MAVRLLHMPPKAHADFPETRWSLVLAAHGERAGQALEELCAAYWFPLYAFARRCGHAAPAAEDLTQGFFELLLSRELLAKADRERGRLRSFLLGAFKKFMLNDHRREHAEKRGGGQAVLSLDQAQAEAWFGAEPAESVPPEHQFDRDWAHITLAQALAALEAEWTRRGKAALFSRLRGFLSWEQTEPQMAAAARDLGLAASAARVAVHRLRLAFRRHLEAQVAQTVAAPDELPGELRHLLAILQK
jgi:RNA polymerase sigma-70 factor (ECF subfamily)